MATIRCGSRTFHNIQAVLFDKDGTLANSAPYLVKLGHYRAEAVDAVVPGLKTDLLRAFGLQGEWLNPAGMLAVSSRQETTTAAATYLASTGRDWHEAMAIAQQAFQTADQNMPRKAETTALLPGARDFLAALHQAEVRLGIISADITSNIDDFVDCQEISAWIDITWGNDRPVAKPSPQAYQQVCQQLGVAPEQTLMFGDAEGDMKMAKEAQAAGSICILCGWPQTTAQSSPLANPSPLASADMTLENWGQCAVI